MRFKTAFLIAFVLIVLPFFNFLLLIISDTPVARPVHDIFIAWTIGFMVLMMELFVLTLPGFIPIFGTVYLNFLGRLLGFPDKASDEAVEDFLNLK